MTSEAVGDRGVGRNSREKGKNSREEKEWFLSLTSPAGFAPRPVEADEVGAARCPPCSQNAHDEAVLAREKSASRRTRGWAGENVARGRGQPWPLP